MDELAEMLKNKTEGHPAPGTLILVQGFLNTWSEELQVEDFATPTSTESWLRQVDLWAGSHQLSTGDHQRILKFRDDLRAFLLDKNELESLNQLAAEVAFQASFNTSGAVGFSPTGSAGDRVLGTLIGAISEGIQAGTWDRLKCCDLPTCGWAFYDSTRSRTKRWCSMKTCGSRHKARAYYKRQQ